MNYTDEIKRQVKDWGADRVGIADLELLRGIKTNPPDLLSPYARAVSIAVSLPNAVFDMIDQQPTPIYASVYKTANEFLNDLALKLSRKLQRNGYLTLPIPASQIVDKKNWYAAISHKAVARAAGLGWQGKNLLLITPEFGSRVRLVTVLTDAPLAPDSPLKNRCGKCILCRDACPADAIKGVNTETYYETRHHAMDFEKCVEKLTQDFAKLPDIGFPICGICIKVCPFGRKIKKSGDVL